MNLQQEKWKKLTLPFDEKIHDALQQQHHASQFIALVGRYLVKPEPDDSNTNMQYSINEESLIGNSFSNGLHLGLKLVDLTLYLHRSESDYLGEILLPGKTKKEVFSEFEQKLSASGADISNLKNELHYEIPDHPLEKDASFNIKDTQFFQESTLYRHNAEIILNALSSEFQNAEPVKVWPHHFDTGTYIPISYNSKGNVSQSIGLGWTIPDSMVDEPYYYLSLWSEQEVENINQLPALEYGQWILSGWQGGVLKHSEIQKINTPEKQSEMVKMFFTSGIKIIRDFYEKN